MEKIYGRINWEDAPSEETPINAERLNKMDSAIDTLDDRVVEISEEVRPIKLGGTGATTAKEAEYNIIGGMAETTAALSDGAMAVFRYSTPTATQGVLLYKKVSLFWDYIKSKISSVLGLTATNYSGTSAKATADGSGNAIVDTYATKTEMSKKWDSTTSRTANTVLAAPNGSNGAGTFRKLVANDLPTVPASKGGTGQTSLVNSANVLMNALTTGDAAPTDNDYYISQFSGGGTTTTTYHRRPVSALWNYIKSKADHIYATKEETPAITFATQEPSTVPENTIVMVYEG